MKKLISFLFFITLIMLSMLNFDADAKQIGNTLVVNRSAVPSQMPISF